MASSFSWLWMQAGEDPSWLGCLMCWRTSLSKHFIRRGVNAPGQQLFTLDTADFWGMMVAVLKQVGTVSCDSEMLKMSVMTSTSWLAHVPLRGPGRYQASSITHIHSPQGCSHIRCGYRRWLLLWRWSRLDSWPFVEEIKASIKGVHLATRPHLVMVWVACHMFLVLQSCCSFICPHF